MTAAPLPRYALLLAAAVVASACEINLNAQNVTEREEKRFTVSGPPQLELATFDGSVEVTSWDRPDVLVVVEKRAPNAESARSIQVNVTQDGNRISVMVVQPRDEFTGIGINVRRSAALIVSVPRTADVSVRSGDGAVSIDGVTGRIDLNTGDGGIRGQRLDGEITIRTGDGAVALDDVRGALEVSTGDGGIRAGGVFERFKAHTGDGAVAVRASAGSRTAAEWEITTGDGSVTLELPEGFDAALDARTGDGRVSTDGLTLSDRQESESGREVRGRVGSGGNALKVRTGDGSIRLGRS